MHHPQKHTTNNGSISRTEEYQEQASIRKLFKSQMLCVWLFPQSTWASLSVSNPFSKFQQDKFFIGPHGYQTPLLYLNLS